MTIHIYFTTDIFSSFFLVAWVHAKLLQLCLTVTSWTVAHQLPLSMGVSSQEYWSDYHAFLQGIFLTWDVGVEPTSPVSPALQADSLPLSHWVSPFPNITLFLTFVYFPFWKNYINFLMW